jgi:integrase
LALTGQRREEVAQLTGDEIDLATRTWTLPASRTKNGKPHIVHLSKAAIAVMVRMPKLGKFVFSLTGTKPFQSFSAAKRDPDKLSGVSDGGCMICVAPASQAWSVADKVLNHQSGTISGVAAVYQRHEFLAERNDALDR